MLIPIYRLTSTAICAELLIDRWELTITSCASCFHLTVFVTGVKTDVRLATHLPAATLWFIVLQSESTDPHRFFHTVRIVAIFTSGPNYRNATLFIQNKFFSSAHTKDRFASIRSRQPSGRFRYCPNRSGSRTAFWFPFTIWTFRSECSGQHSS